MGSVGEHALVQLAARFSERDRRHDPVESAVEVMEVLLQRHVFQRLSPPSDRHGPQQQPPERRAERRVAAVDSVCRIAQQMRQADLPFDAVAPLAGEHVGDPNLGPDRAEQGCHDSLAAAGFDYMQHRRGGDEHPFPPVLAFDPDRGLVRTDHRGGQHDFLDRRGGVQQRLPRSGQDVADRTLADQQREQFVHQQRKPFHADGMGVMQIHHHRGDGVAERRSLLKPDWGFGGHSFAATLTTAAEQAHLGYIGADRWQLNALINLLRGLRRLGERGLALRAGGQSLVDRAIRVRMQRPTDTGTAFAWRAILAGRRKVFLLSLRGRLR
jgi:hypothetical protein